MNNIESNKIDQMLNEFQIIDTQISNKLKVIYSKHEVWRKIKNYDNYSISSFGRVRNDDTDRFLKPQKNLAGYHHVRLSKNGKVKNYLISRLVGIAFLPNHYNKAIVDHIDSKEITNNNILNLRWSTVSQNFCNKDKYKSNVCGFKGVCWHKASQKYRARINIEGKQKHLGYFQTAEDASEVYEQKAKELHGEFYYKNNQ